jgi:hypothetical protein
MAAHCMPIHPLLPGWSIAACGTCGSIFAWGLWDPKASAGPVGRTGCRGSRDPGVRALAYVPGMGQGVPALEPLFVNDCGFNLRHNRRGFPAYGHVRTASFI